MHALPAIRKSDPAYSSTITAVVNSHSIRSLLCAAALSVAAACSSGPEKRQEPVSLLGAPLVVPPMSEGRQKWLELELEAAMAAWEFQPNEMHAIWVGRRLAYLGRYPEAIAWYLGALQTYTDSYRLRRHAGHRLLTVRRVDDAIAALTEARSLAAAEPNRLEPDGAPGPSGEPRSSTHGNIDYHLALAHYVKGDFDAAADLWLTCVRAWAMNDDARVAALHWAFTSLVRAGRAEEAAAALELVPTDPDVIENFAYADLVQLYRGELSVDVLLERENRSAALDYGIARFLIASGDTARGAPLLRRLAESPGWTSFGVLAAEADLAGELGRVKAE